MKTRSIFNLLIIGFILLSCSQTKPDTRGFENAALVAEDVIAENLMPWIERLALLREQDTPVDNTGFEENDMFPSSHLTRDSAVVMVKNAFITMGYEPYIIELSKNNLTAFNVFAEIRGSELPDEYILVGSHLDAFYAGADDNGSAIAAMLEAARVLKNYSFKRSIRFAAFDLEEFGSVGSTRYVEAGYAHDIKAAIVMDMIGYSSEEENSQDDVMGIRLPDKGDFLFIAGNDNSRKMVQQMTALNYQYNLTKTVGGIAAGDGTSFLGSMFMRSDHGLLWYKNIPAVLMTDTANFRNKNYHKSSDTPESLDPAFLYRNTKALTAATALFAGIQLQQAQ
ncbi:MAG TPA: M28 family peptidase [Candidatus Cloacimonadota bacterium]|nr:M28 family peptidase [Candidatus Cloacimonadota bacterium]